MVCRREVFPKLKRAWRRPSLSINVFPLGPSVRARSAVGDVLADGVHDRVGARRVADISEERARGNIIIHTLRAGIPVARAAAPSVCLLYTSPSPRD